MLKIRILSVGKTKESWLKEAIEEYTRRLKGSIQLETAFAKDDAGLMKLVEQENELILLDIPARQVDSKEFSLKLFEALEQGGSRLAFVIGGAEGLPEELRISQHQRISLSKMTLTHQLARLILVEQIYRAVQIRQGTPYHK